MKRPLILALLSIGLLAGCGGGDDDGGAVDEAIVTPPSPPPICSTGQVLENGICVTLPPSPVCSADQVLENGVCVTASAGTVFRDCEDGCPEMVVIPAGSFMMGALDTDRPEQSNRPRHEVTFAKPFAVGRYPVTVKEWEAFIQASGYQGNPFNTVYSEEFDCSVMGQSDLSLNPNDPASCMNWYEAQAYVTWLSGQTGKTYRLLSESEWEYAARAGTQTSFPFPAPIPTDAVGNPITNAPAEFANYRDNYYDYDKKQSFEMGALDGYRYFSPVGSYPANNFGLYDMMGNVWEWLQDCWHGSYVGAPTDGSAWVDDQYGNCFAMDVTPRQARGGSWSSLPYYLRASFTGGSLPIERDQTTGFRVARAIP
jgi:formylglycine-generating enzyme required for sulfatase activity